MGPKLPDFLYSLSLKLDVICISALLLIAAKVGDSSTGHWKAEKIED